MKLNHLFYSILIAFMHVSVTANAADKHVHGEAELYIAIEGNKVLLELESPADNILGFEHQPSTPQQEKQVADAMAELQTYASLIEFKGAECTQVSADLDSPFEVHDDHKEHAHEKEHDHHKEHAHEKEHDDHKEHAHEKEHDHHKEHAHEKEHDDHKEHAHEKEHDHHKEHAHEKEHDDHKEHAHEKEHDDHKEHAHEKEHDDHKEHAHEKEHDDHKDHDHGKHADHEKEVHSEFHLAYTLTCTNAEGISSAEVTAFSHFSYFNKIQVNWVRPTGQGGQKTTASSKTIKF